MSLQAHSVAMGIVIVQWMICPIPEIAKNAKTLMKFLVLSPAWEKFIHRMGLVPYWADILRHVQKNAVKCQTLQDDGTMLLWYEGAQGMTLIVNVTQVCQVSLRKCGCLLITLP